MWHTYLQPVRVEEALRLLRHHGEQARIVAGGTDVLVELQRGVQPTTTLIDITALQDLKYVRDEGTHIALGALATHNDVIASAVCVQACFDSRIFARRRFAVELDRGLMEEVPHPAAGLHHC